MKLIHQWEGGLHKHDTQTHILGFYSSIDVKNVSIQVLSLYTKPCGCTYCYFVVKAPANAIMQHKQRQLGQNQFDMFYQNYCCAAIHGQI